MSDRSVTVNNGGCGCGSVVLVLFAAYTVWCVFGDSGHVCFWEGWF